MQSFGKRIYYDNTSGNVFLVTNEMMGEGIKQLTIEEDREVYTALSERTVDSYSHIQLSYGEHSQEFSRGNPTSINAETKKIVWTPHNPVEEEKRATLEQEIAELKLEKDQIKADNLMLMEAVFDLFAMVAVQQGA